MKFLLIFLTLVLLSAALIRIFLKFASHWQPIDVPNQRSSHQVPTPRGGGMVFMVLWLLFVLLIYCFGEITQSQFWLFNLALPLVVIGYLDDHYSLNARWRFMTQILVAVLAVVLLHGVGDVFLGVWKIHLYPILLSSFAVLLLVWSTNLFNFMDGIDGISGVEALFTLLPLGYWALDQGDSGLSIGAWGLAASVLGFLVWNWPKAKIFMGDAGSTALGFLIILFALMLEKTHSVSIFNLLVCYGWFLFDATLTLVRRIVAREPFYQAHRSHAYQRLQDCGWSHRKILKLIIICNSGLLVLGLWMYHDPAKAPWAMALALVELVLAYGYIEYKQPMFVKL